MVAKATVWVKVVLDLDLIEMTGLSISLATSSNWEFTKYYCVASGHWQAHGLAIYLKLLLLVAVLFR